MDNVAPHAIALLLDMTLKSLFLLAIAGIALLCLRRSSAAVRHLVLLLTLAGLLLLPLLSSLLPGWRVALLPHHAAVLPPAAVASMPDALPMPPQTTGSLPSTPSPTPNTSSATSDASSAAPMSRTVSIPWTLYGFVLWWMGAVAVAAPVLAGLFCVFRIGRRSVPVTASLFVALMAELSRELGIRQTVTLRQSGEENILVMPMTWGWLLPMILLPSRADMWPEERLRVVLLHELAHIRRGDWLWQMLGHVVCALYWFHPGVWLVARGLRAESERASDDLVLSAGIPAPDYARHLVDVARSLSGLHHLTNAAIPMADASQIGSRVRSVLNGRKKRDMVTKTRMIFAATLAAAMVTPLAALRPPAKAQAVPHTISATDRAKANARVSAVHAVPGEADANKLFEDSRHLTPRQGKELEQQLSADPDNLLLRIRLLGYYSGPSFGITNPKRNSQILWLIRNHPENVLLGRGETMMFPTYNKQNASAFNEAKQLWLSYANGPSPKAKILGNGASFLTVTDFSDAEMMLLKAETIEPPNPQWPSQLGSLYLLQATHDADASPEFRAWAKMALVQFQRVPGSDPKTSHDVSTLVDVSTAAYDAEDYETARISAQRLLVLPDLDQQSVGMKSYDERSTALHKGHLILGLLALRDGNVAQAKEHLLEMGNVKGSPLSYFGPNMRLAQALLTHGDRQTVLAYLDECEKFWKHDYGALDRWRTQIKNGQSPDFNSNLWY